METIAVFANDAPAARHVLQPMLASRSATHWIVVACPPTLTRHASRWVSRGARRQWRERWAAELFAGLAPELGKLHSGDRVETLIARRPLTEVSAQLVARWPGVRLLDARRARLGALDEPLTAAQPALAANGWAAPVAATAGFSLVLALAD